MHWNQAISKTNHSGLSNKNNAKLKKQSQANLDADKILFVLWLKLKWMTFSDIFGPNWILNLKMKLQRGEEWFLKLPECHTKLIQFEKDPKSDFY